MTRRSNVNEQPPCPARGRAVHRVEAWPPLDPVAIAVAFLEEQDAAAQVSAWLGELDQAPAHA